MNAQGASVCETTFDQEVVGVSKQMHEAKAPRRWKTYAAFLKKYGPCLDGGYAETVQEISEAALANDWKGLTKFIEVEHPNQKFLRKIESGFSMEMGDGERLKAIQANAKKHCPKQIKKFCAEIAKAKL
jgi:hypothetical protein